MAKVRLGEIDAFMKGYYPEKIKKGQRLPVLPKK